MHLGCLSKYAILRKKKEAASYQLAASEKFAHNMEPNARICVCQWWRRSSTGSSHILQSVTTPHGTNLHNKPLCCGQKGAIFLTQATYHAYHNMHRY